MPLNTLQGPKQINIDALKGQKIGLIGFGNQGRSHALNLRDSGLEVCIGAREKSMTRDEAAELGFTVSGISETVAASDLVILSLPDEVHQEVFTNTIEPALQSGCVIGFLHGFSVHFGLVKPPKDVGVVMVAPKGPGIALRMRFEEGLGLPCLLAVQQESPAGNARAMALAWAAGLGAANATVVETTFGIEAETDLFGEQGVLCGGLLALLQSGFETLVKAGYPPEIAYLECCQEIKQIADLVFEKGVTEMLKAISNTAEFGLIKGHETIRSEQLAPGMQNLLDSIKDGSFAQAMQQQHADGSKEIHRNRQEIAASEMESAGKTVRSWMPWLNNAKPSE
ncbi:MAG: ketol-acid reductoisomerase [Phycisphaerales bacterium]|nr:ketol-acid reductoisomerase [Phycisphaerales bacterium]